MTEDLEEEITDFDSMDDAQRRRLLRRLREIPPACHKNESPYVPDSELDFAWRVAVDRVGGRFVSEQEKQRHLQPAIERLIDEAAIHRIDIGRAQAVSLIEGVRLTVNGTVYRANRHGDLITRKEPTSVDKLWLKMRDVHGVNTSKLRFDPVGEYKRMIEQFLSNQQ